MEKNENPENEKQAQDIGANDFENPQKQAKDCECNSLKRKTHLSLLLNAFLLVLVGFLFFTQNNTAEIQDAGPVSLRDSSDGIKYNIAYVNSDTLMKQYRLFDTYKEKIQNRKSQLENEIGRRFRNFEKEVEDFQKKVQSYAISSAEAQRLEMDLMQKQEQLLMLRESMSEELIEMEFSHQEALLDSITKAIHQYNKLHDFDYVLGYSKGSGILLANEKYDITKEVLEILNQ